MPVEYLVQNNRPRRTVKVCGRLLSAKMKGGKSEAWLTEEEFKSNQVQRLGEMGRLVLLGTRGEEAPPTPAPVAKPVHVTEPEPEPVRAHEKDGTFKADDPATPDVNEAFDPPKPIAALSFDDLMGNKKDWLVAKCEELGLSTDGIKKDLASRIAAHQGDQ